MLSKQETAVTELLRQVEEHNRSVAERTHFFYTNPSYTPILLDPQRGNSIAESPSVTMDET